MIFVTVVVVNTLYSCLLIPSLISLFKALTSTASVIEEGKDPHYDFAKEISARFVGRKVLMSKALATIDEIQNKSKENIVLITGKSGSGKTAFMVRTLFYLSPLEQKSFKADTSNILLH